MVPPDQEANRGVVGPELLFQGWEASTVFASFPKGRVWTLLLWLPSSVVSGTSLAAWAIVFKAVQNPFRFEIV